ncbi:MAG: organic hydroperoxide resistance protein [Rhizobiales bacterium]|nr:organic hydroperoxide resistance protein [Hyphomicrobiales bacterium]
MKKLYTAVATSTGGRGNGHSKTADGMLDLKIGTPKELGGTADGVNPEQLFAVGYSTCYLGAIKFVAGKEKTPVAISPDSTVTAHVTMGSRDDKKGFELAVKLEVNLPGVKKAQAKALAEKAHVVCPYSYSIRKTVDVVTKFV